MIMIKMIAFGGAQLGGKQSWAPSSRWRQWWRRADTWWRKAGESEAAAGRGELRAALRRSVFPLARCSLPAAVYGP